LACDLNMLAAGGTGWTAVLGNWLDEVPVDRTGITGRRPPDAALIARRIADGRPADRGGRQDRAATGRTWAEGKESEEILAAR